jgi:hypothetical protein
MRAEKKIFNYIGLERVFYKGKYRHTKVVRGAKFQNSSFLYTDDPLIPNTNKLKINDIFIEEITNELEKN